MPADLILRNAVIHTMGDAQPTAQALGVKNGRIEWVGASQDASGYRRAGTQVVDLQGQTVLPGFIDAHQHQLYMGLSFRQVNARPGNVASIQDILDRVATRAQELPATRWIEAYGYHDARLAERRDPTRSDLDRAAPVHPVLLTRTCGHVMVVNSQALTLAGIDRNTPDPAGGSLDRDPHTGEPTGILRETAMSMVRRILPPPSATDLRQAVLAGAVVNLRKGITSVWEPSIEPDHLRAYQDLHENQALPIRVVMAHKKVLRSGEEAPLPQPFRTEWLSLKAIKLFQDGGFGAATAALTAPYANKSDTSGHLIWEQAELDERVREVREAGLGISIHAIGDRAILCALGAIEQLGEEARQGVLLRIEHCGLPLPPIPEQIKRLRVSAVMQPVFLWFDGDVYAERVGAERARWLYPVRTMLDHDILTAGSSDGPVVPDVNPLLGMYAAATRLSNSSQSIAPEESISVFQALQLYTRYAAEACGEGNHRGRLEPGLAADMVVLEEDPLRVPLGQLPEIPVRRVFVNGQEVELELPRPP